MTKIRLTKKILSAVVVFVMMVGFLPVVSVRAEDKGEIVFCATSGSELTQAMVTEQLVAAGVGSGDTFSATLDSSVTTIGNSAFYQCFSLKSIVIPDNVISIGNSAFSNCYGLTSVVFGNSVTTIGDFAFSECRVLTSVNIPDSVTSIGSSAFYLCQYLTSIVISDSVTFIGDYAFYYCDKLKEFTVNPGNSTYSSLEGVLFDKNKTRLITCPGGKSGSYVIPDSVALISYGAFDNCSGLTSVVIPNSVTSIGDYAFRSCYSLTSVIIPDSATFIGDYAFSGCGGITSVTIPDSVTFIGDYAFSFCVRLKEFTVNPGNSTYSTFEGVLFDKNQTTLVKYTEGISGSYVIPDSVTSIGCGAFLECRGLTGVVIPDSVTSIGDRAFSYCSGLTSVIIPDNVTSIGDWAFNSSGLTSVVIPDSVTSIGDWAFSYCSGLTSVVIGNSVSIIGYNVFRQTLIQTITLPASYRTSKDLFGMGPFSVMPSLENIVFKPDTTAIPAYTFSGISTSVNVYIPKTVASISPGSGLGANTKVYAYAGSFAEKYAIDNSLPYEIMPTILAEELPVGYQYLPYSFSFASSEDSWLEVLKGTLPPGLQISVDNSDPKRAQGEIWGAPLEAGTFEVTVRATDGTPYLLEDDEVTFVIEIEPEQTDDWLKQLNSNKIKSRLGEGSGGYEQEGIWFVDVYDTAPFVDMVIEFDDDDLFNCDYDDFIDLWICGIQQTRDIDYSAEPGSTVATVYGRTIAKHNELCSQTDHVIAGEFKKSGEADGEQYKAAQNFRINVVPRPGTGSIPDNTGDSNTGDSNTGDSNTGDSNSGDSNTGDSDDSDDPDDFTPPLPTPPVSPNGVLGTQGGGSTGGVGGTLPNNALIPMAEPVGDDPSGEIITPDSPPVAASQPSDEPELVQIQGSSPLSTASTPDPPDEIIMPDSPLIVASQPSDEPDPVQTQGSPPLSAASHPDPQGEPGTNLMIFLIIGAAALCGFAFVGPRALKKWRFRKNA